MDRIAPESQPEGLQSNQQLLIRVDAAAQITCKQRGEQWLRLAFIAKMPDVTGDGQIDCAGLPRPTDRDPRGTLKERPRGSGPDVLVRCMCVARSPDPKRLDRWWPTPKAGPNQSPELHTRRDFQRSEVG